MRARRAPVVHMNIVEDSEEPGPEIAPFAPEMTTREGAGEAFLDQILGRDTITLERPSITPQSGDMIAERGLMHPPVPPCWRATFHHKVNSKPAQSIRRAPGGLSKPKLLVLRLGRGAGRCGVDDVHAGGPHPMDLNHHLLRAGERKMGCIGGVEEERSGRKLLRIRFI